MQTVKLERKGREAIKKTIIFVAHLQFLSV